MNITVARTPPFSKRETEALAAAIAAEMNRPPGPDAGSYHPPDECAGESCCFHNPSDHHMRDWPMTIRGPHKGFLTERICPHGVGHPDPDSLAWLERNGVESMDVHGCDRDPETGRACCATTITPRSTSGEMPELSIDRANNGWLLTLDDGDEVPLLTVIEEMDGDVPGMSMLREVIELLGLMGSRGDAQRLYIGAKAGDKHHDNHPQACEDCECPCETTR